MARNKLPSTPPTIAAVMLDPELTGVVSCAPGTQVCCDVGPGPVPVFEVVGGVVVGVLEARSTVEKREGSAAANTRNTVPGPLGIVKVLLQQDPGLQTPLLMSPQQHHVFGEHA